MNTHTRVISAERFASFRRQVLRNGGAIVQSSPTLTGFQVTYVARIGA